MASPTPDALAPRLRAARRSQGLTQQEVADRLGVARTTVVAIEAAQRQLTADLIVRLASAYGVSVSSLVAEGAEPASLTGQFRLPASASDAERSELDRAVALLERHAARYLRLEQLTKSALSPSLVPRYAVAAKPPEAEGEAVAEAERRRHGLGDDPLHNLRELLEREAGIRVFGLTLPGSVAAVFGTSPGAGPCVAFNRDHPATRQRWSLAHEYAHFLTTPEKPEVWRHQAYERLPAAERFAERFAAAFLMPRAGLVGRLRSLASGRPDVNVESLVLLATEYGVSLQALALRLEDLALAPAGTWDRLESLSLRMSKVARVLGITVMQPDKRTFPDRYLMLTLLAYENEEITESQACELLDLDRLTFRERLRSAPGDAEDHSDPAPVPIRLGA